MADSQLQNLKCNKNFHSVDLNTNLQRYQVLVFLFLSGLPIFSLFRASICHYPNVDEIAHLPAGVSHLKFERFDLYRVNPPLVRLLASIPEYIVDGNYNWDLYDSSLAARSEFSIGRETLEMERIELVNRYFWPRVICICFVFLLVFAFYQMTSRLFGPLVGGLCIIWCGMDPNMLAHVPTIVPDGIAAILSILSAYLCCLYVRVPSRKTVLASACATGLLMLVKLTGLVFLVAYPLTIALIISIYRKSLPSRSLRLRLLDAASYFLFAILIVNCGYFFEDSMTPLGEYRFCSDLLGNSNFDGVHSGNRFHGNFLSAIPVPLPRNYLLGIDYLRYEVENKYWSFLMGEWKFGSWPHYYVMTTLFKTPEPTLIASAFGLILLFRCWYQRKIGIEVISFVALLGIPALAAFASVSLQGGFNHHHRYVLMIYPVMFVLAAFPASNYIEARWPKIVTSLLCVWMVIASLSVSPHYLSYFNTISGGPKNGWKLLGFSNIDWGQDLLFVDQWIKEHPECRPLRFELDYFGMNGEMFDLPKSNPPRLPKGSDYAEALPDQTEWWIVSVKQLYNLPDRAGLEYLQQLEPVDRIAYSFHVYKMPGHERGED